MKKNQRGFGVVELLFVVVIVAIVGAGAWYVGKHSNKSTTNTTKVVNCTNSSLSGAVTAGMISVDRSKLPCGWGATPSTYTSDSTDYQEQGFRYAIQLDNSNSLKDNSRNNPALCYVGVYQIYRAPGDNRAANDYVQSDIAAAKSNASSGGVTINVAPTSEISINTSQGSKQLPAATYTVTYKDQGSQTQYSKGAYLPTDNYVGKVAITCHSQQSIDEAVKDMSAALTFQ